MVNTVCDQKSTLFRFQKISSHFKNKPLNMGKLVTERICPKTILLRKGKFSNVAICKQLHLKNLSMPRTPMVGFGSAEVRMKDTILIVRYHPPTIVDRFTFGVSLFTIGQCASSKHQKMQFVGLYPHFRRSWSSVFLGIGIQVG